jgi:hypothetical protein
MAARVFGDIPGYPEGTYFASRVEASRAGVHRPTQGGISGSTKEGADSIVVSGGYEDDRDLGAEIVYIGHGGRDPETGEQVADQELSTGNLALIRSGDNDLPVRVVRGANSRSQFAPKAGYRYDGLYRVAEYWQQKGKSGHLVWCFRLKKINAETAPWHATPPAHLVAKIAKSTQTSRAPNKPGPVVKPSIIDAIKKAREAVPTGPTFSVGDKVKHSTFGEGTVSEVTSLQGDQTLVIDFGGHGTKKLLASKAKLELASHH